MHHLHCFLLEEQPGSGEVLVCACVRMGAVGALLGVRLVLGRCLAPLLPHKEKFQITSGARRRLKLSLAGVAAGL